MPGSRFRNKNATHTELAIPTLTFRKLNKQLFTYETQYNTIYHQNIICPEQMKFYLNINYTKKMDFSVWTSKSVKPLGLRKCMEIPIS